MKALGRVILAVGCALLGACGGAVDDGGAVGGGGAVNAGGEVKVPPTHVIEVYIPLATDPCGAVTATASVAGPVRDIDPVPLEVGADSIQGVIPDVPVGQQHLVYVRVYNSSGLPVYWGNASVDVYEERQGIANLPMYSNPRDCPSGGTEPLYIMGRVTSGPS